MNKWKEVLIELLAFLECFKKPRAWKVEVTVITEAGNMAEYSHIENEKMIDAFVGGNLGHVPTCEGCKKNKVQ